MTPSITRFASLTLLTFAVALGGCGDSDKEAGKTTPASSPEEFTAEADAPKPVPARLKKEAGWAKQLCTQMAGKATVVQPPAVEGTKPAETKKALVTFFGEVTDQLSGQIKVIEDVGPPPSGAAAKAWKPAVAQLKDTRTKVGKIETDLKATNPKTEKDVAAVVAKLGEQMSVLNAYLGPISDLSKNKDLELVLAAEPACSKVS